MLSKELVAASTKPLVLAILAEGESYGYELIRRVRELSDDRIRWSEGMLYPFLHWMEAEGLIESSWKESDTGRRRRYYRISRKGGKQLELEREQWLGVHETLKRLWKRKIIST
jgi:PadR family transcriptional regulator, regulatory protein PadR